MASYAKWKHVNAALCVAIASLLAIGAWLHLGTLDAERERVEADLAMAQLTADLSTASDWTAGIEAIAAQHEIAQAMLTQVDALVLVLGILAFEGWSRFSTAVTTRQEAIALADTQMEALTCWKTSGRYGPPIPMRPRFGQR